MELELSSEWMVKMAEVYGLPTTGLQYLNITSGYGEALTVEVRYVILHPMQVLDIDKLPLNPKRVLNDD
jgi:hypothetical protein